MTAEKLERIEALKHQIRAQWRKYDEARGRVPYVALMQIDQKLARLEREAETLILELEQEVPAKSDLRVSGTVDTVPPRTHT